MAGMDQGSNRYADIIDRERPRHHADDFSRRHPPMPLEERAKIILPFAALKGYEQKVEEKEIIYDPENGLSEDMLQDLNDQMLKLQTLLRQGIKPRVRVRCFIKKDGTDGEGRELWKEGQCEHIYEVRQVLEVAGNSIPFASLREIVIIQ